MSSYESERNYSLGYIDPSDSSAKHIQECSEYFYTTHYPANAAHWVQANIDKRFKIGDQRLWNQVFGDNSYFGSRQFFFNLIRRHINMICGYQRQHRKSTICVPNHEEDQLCDDYNQVMKWCEQRDGFHEYQSQSFEGAVDTGINLLHLSISYLKDPYSGDLITENIDFPNFVIDSNFRKQDLSDCSGIYRRRWVSSTMAKALLPGRAAEIDKMKPKGMKDGKFQLQAELLNLTNKNLFSYDEFYYRSTRQATMIIDPYTQEGVEWVPKDDDPEDALNQVLRQEPWRKVVKLQVPTVRLAISVNGQAMYDGENLLGIDSYPMVPSLCYYEPDVQSLPWRCMGVTRNLRDVQFLYNMRKVLELDLLQSQVTNAWAYPVDVVVDPKAFRQTSNGCLIPLKAGRSVEEIKRFEAPGVHPSIIEISRLLQEDMAKIVGTNEELLGLANDEVSGVLSMARQGAALTTLQGIFDKADYTQKLFGKIRLEAIIKRFKESKVRRILGRDPDPKFFDLSSLKYDITTEEGAYSSTQRSLELQQIIYFRKELGIPIPDKSILDASFITNKRKILEDIANEQKQQEEQMQQQAESQAKMDESKMFSIYARARADLAKEQDLQASAQEKLSKIEEHEASAEQKKSMADLDIVKMLMGLESMEIEGLKKNLEIVEMLKLTENQNRQGEYGKKE